MPIYMHHTHTPILISIENFDVLTAYVEIFYTIEKLVDDENSLSHRTKFTLYKMPPKRCRSFSVAAVAIVLNTILADAHQRVY